MGNCNSRNCKCKSHPDWKEYVRLVRLLREESLDPAERNEIHHRMEELRELGNIKGDLLKEANKGLS